MPTSANVTTSEGLAFTVPEGARSPVIYNESDTEIRFRFGKTVSATTTAGTATTGLPIPAKVDTLPGVFGITFPEPLKNPLPVKAIHGGSGDKTLTWDSFAL
jgi:hypothetical protein